MGSSLNTTIVLGIGNPLLQDDRAGLEVVRRLNALQMPLDTEELYTVGFEVMDRLLGYERAFVVDACSLGREPGTVLRMGINDMSDGSSLSSSHSITLGETLKTGYSLFPREMPGQLTILLIQVGSTDLLTGCMTPAVQKGVQTAVEMILSEIGSPPVYL